MIWKLKVYDVGHEPAIRRIWVWSYEPLGPREGPLIVPRYGKLLDDT